MPCSYTGLLFHIQPLAFARTMGDVKQFLYFDCVVSYSIVVISVVMGELAMDLRLALCKVAFHF